MHFTFMGLSTFENAKNSLQIKCKRRVMIIYVEYVIIDNMVINSLILLLTKELLKLKGNKLKLVISSMIGTAVAMISPILPSIVNSLIKLPLALLMIAIAFDISTIKKYTTSLFTFFCITFLFGGAVIGIGEMFGIKFIFNNGVMYEYKFPVGIIILICFVMFVVLKNIMKYVFQKQKNSQLIFEAKLTDNGKTVNATAFLDTGNKIVIDEKPVCIIGYKTFNLLYPTISLTNILLKKPLNLKNSKYIEIESIGSTKQNLLSFEIDCLQIEKTQTKNARVALSLVNFSQKTESDLIVSNLFLGDNYEYSKN